jgi:hypothetical protein
MNRDGFLDAAQLQRDPDFRLVEPMSLGVSCFLNLDRLQVRKLRDQSLHPDIVQFLAMRLDQVPAAVSPLLDLLDHGLLVLVKARPVLGPLDEKPALQFDAQRLVRGVADQRLRAVLPDGLVERVERLDADQVDLRVAFALVEDHGRVRGG